MAERLRTSTHKENIDPQQIAQDRAEVPISHEHLPFHITRILGRVAFVTAIAAGVGGPRIIRWIFLRFSKRRKEANILVGDSIAKISERLGPFYLKLAQMISHRSDLFSEETLIPLRRIQDRVKPESFDRSRRTLESSFQRDLNRIFTTFNPKPIAAGSVATVYEATRIDGKKVAVKVVRSDVSQALLADLAIGSWVTSVIRKIPVFRGIPVRECYDETQKLFVNQLNMNLEAANLDKMHNDAFVRSHFNIPRPHRDLLSQTVLVMDLIEHSVSLSSDKIGEIAYRKTATSMLLVLYRMVFELGAVHCDMHPGNLLLDDSGQAWLIDGGFFADLNKRDTDCFRDIFLGLAYGESSRLLDGIVKSAVSVPSNIDKLTLRHDVAEIINIHSGKRAGSFLVVEFVLDLFKLQKRYCIFARSNLVAAIWSFVTFEGIVRGRMPDMDFQGEAKPFVVSEIIGRMRLR